MEKRQPNDLNAAVPKFCLALEEFRRTNDGRVRTSQELLMIGCFASAALLSVTIWLTSMRSGVQALQRMSD